MAQMADILIGSILPLHPHFGKNPRISLQLLQDEKILDETRAVAGDEDGIWEINSPLNLPDTAQLLTLALVVHSQDSKRRLASAKFRIESLFAQIKASPNEYYEFTMCDSCASLQVILSFSSKKATTKISETLSPHPVTDVNRYLANEAINGNEQKLVPEESSSFNREDLRRAYTLLTYFPKSEKKWEMLSNLGCAYYALYQKGRDAEDLDNAISIQREAVNLGCFHPQLAQHLENLSSALQSRYDYKGNRTDIDEAIQASQNALGLTQRDAGRADRLMQLAANLDCRSKRVGDVADIDMAISTYSEGIALMPEGSPDKARGHNNFALALVRRFERLGVMQDLDRAILNMDTALSLSTNDHQQNLSLYNNLGVALQIRFEHLGNLTDLEMSISNKKSAVSLTPDGHPNKPSRYTNLGNALHARFGRLGDLADLNNAILNQENAVRLMPDGHPDKPSAYFNLGNALESRFDRLGALNDLEMAISNKQSALSLLPDGHPDKPLRYGSLGDALQSRFRCLGDLADLNNAISNKQIAVMLTPDGHPGKPALYNRLGNALQFRFGRLGDLTDLNNAISNLENAVRLTSDGHPNKLSRYNNLGNALESRFDRLGDLTDLEMAISIKEKALSLTPDGHPDKPSRYSNLGNALGSRFERLGDLADLNNAISNKEIAVRLTPDGHPAKASLYTNLVAPLNSRFECLGDIADLNKAISNQENALSLMSDGYPDKVGMTSNLARCYERRFELYAKISDLHLAHSLFATAAQSPAGYPQHRFKAAYRWSHCAKLTNSSPLSAYKCAIDQLPRIAWLGIPVSEQHSLLEEIGGAVRDAVAAAIEAEEYEMAVEWMEQGRSIVWQNLLKLRAPIDALRASHPELANRLHSISQQLDPSPSREPKSQTLEDEPRQEIAKSHSSLAIEWDKTVDQIRRQPNFESFLKPKGFESLATAANEGPVVILNVAKDRCDALALVSDGNSVGSTVPIPLENLSLDKSIELLGGLRKLLVLSGVRDRDTRGARRVGSKADPNTMFKPILRALWVDIMKPVVDGLAFQPRTGNLPRIWWCVTGALTFLPIHAAGDYDKMEPGHKLSDYVVSSYTPTLTAILDSSYPNPSESFKLLTVAQPSAPGLSEIPKTMDEVKRIQKIASSILVASLAKEDATVERVQKGIRESNWVHLACHGKQDAAKPLDSGLILHDGTLKLSTIVKETLPNAEFAFLSACQTATGDLKVMEESAHLAAGMLLAGYKGVIATMWSIRDDIAPQVTEIVYSRMLKDGMPNRKEAAHALHEAVKQLRESGADFTSWVPFIHIGR